MPTSSTYDEVLNFAINSEREAASLYEKYAGIVKSAATRQLLTEMADMEKGHERLLRGLKANSSRKIAQKQPAVKDLHISSYLVDVPIRDDSPIEDVFIFAMKAEEKARQLYESLAKLAADPEARDLFQQLAGQEKRHKLDLETEYDKGVLAWN